MSATDDATYLLGLPSSVQTDLAKIAQAADSMTSEERGFAAALFATVGQHFGLGNGSADYLPGAQMVTCLGLLLRHAHDADLAAARMTEGT